MRYNFNWNAVSGGAPYVTISTTAIAFNSVSIEKLGLPEKVLIGFDESQCVIGVKAYRGELNVKPYEFARKIKNGWIRIGCKDFIRYLESLTGESFSTAKKFLAEYDNINELLVATIARRGGGDSGDSKT